VKERLTGAIILVALMVLLVPELLTGPIRSAPRAASVAPSAEEPPLRSYTINLADDAHSRSTAATSSGPQQPTLLEAGAPGGSAAAQAGAAESTPPAAASTTHRAPQPAAPAAVVPAKSAPASTAAPALAAMSVAAGSWMVQLGSFASRANAERLARQVRAGGFKVSVSQATAGRRLFRVRVGPAHDREAASQLAAKLRAAGHDGSIVPK
jgi:DedD protein